MLRINLLPIKAARRSQMGKRQIFLFVAIILLSIGLLVLVHKKYVSKDTGDLAVRIEKLKKEIGAVKAKTGDVGALEKKRKRYQKRRKAYRQVLAGCFCRCSGEKTMKECTDKCGPTQKMLRFCPGPVLAMRELSRILSERYGPTLKPDLEPSRRSEYYNPNWDPKGVTVTTWEENGGQLKILGGAKATGDVAELEKRLKVSRFFTDVIVQKTNLAAGGDKVAFYQFDITAKVLY